MIDERKYKELKKQAECAKATRDRAAGQLESAMERLRDEFGCTTIAEAKKLAKQLENDCRAAEGDYDKALADFESKYEEQIAEQAV